MKVGWALPTILMRRAVPALQGAGEMPMPQEKNRHNQGGELKGEELSCFTISYIR
jgi:hypothetical protein